MPPAPPVRTIPAHYHFHTYDYAGAVTFQTSPAQPWARNNWQFYGLVQDLNGSAAFGAGVVPNLAAIPTVVGGPTTQGRHTLMLSFGNLGNVPGRPTVVITGGVHAREWIAAEVAYLIAEYLIANYMAPVAGNPHQARRSRHRSPPRTTRRSELPTCPGPCTARAIKSRDGTVTQGSTHA